jgi:phage terminase large subunit
MKLSLEATPVFDKNIGRTERIVINEGSSRSSKTYSLMQMFVIKLFREKDILITVVRKTLPALKSTAYRDFLDILKSNNLYVEYNHNKTELTYTINSNEIEFISVDNFQKIKGRKRTYLFCNEANELVYNDFTQLAMRTTKQIFMDYNPSHDEYHWLEEKVKTRDDVYIIKSTYKDNPFNTPEVIKEIERLRETDPNLWRIYGLGLMGIASARIWTHFELVDEMPEGGETMYGLDFGYNHPTALMHIKEYDDAYYVDELIYESGLTNNDLIEKMRQLEVQKGKFVFCDSAEPNRIEEIRRAGFNAHSSDKDVKKGIDTVKSKKIYVTKRSTNVLKEYKGYSWKTTADGKILDEPVRVNDDAMCAIRYPINTYNTNKANRPNIRLL